MLAQVVKHANDKEEFQIERNIWKKINLKMIQSKEKKQSYRIMIILTSGQMIDYTETVDEIVKASSLPISFIFIGIGDNDFSSFNKIDSELTPL